MTVVVDIFSGCGISIYTRHGNYPNKSKLALHKPLLYYNNQLKQLYLSDKAKGFNYNSGFVWRRRIEPFKRTAGLGYRYVAAALGYWYYNVIEETVKVPRN